jgi:hypothetical protein
MSQIVHGLHPSLEQSPFQQWTTVGVLSTNANNAEADVTHIKQCAILIVARIYNSGLQSEGRVIAVNGWEGNVYDM